MFDVKYIRLGIWATLATFSSYIEAEKFKDTMHEKCGGMWRTDPVTVLNTYEDGMAMFGDFNPHK